MMDFVSVRGVSTNVSRIGFGCAAIGGYDYGAVDDHESIAAVHQALDSGINFFDTADVYGLGHSETVLGRALASKRSEAIVATKVGVRWESDGTTSLDSSPAYIRSAVEASLRRLRREYIDLYQIHWYDAKTPIDATLETLSELVAVGKVKAFGCCNFSPTLLRSAISSQSYGHPGLSTSQLSINAGDTSRMCDAALAVASGLAVIAYNVLAQGIYSGKYGHASSFEGTDLRQRSAMFSSAALDSNLRVFERLRTIGGADNRTPVQTAIRWVLDAAPVAIALVGFKRPAQVAEAVGAGGWKLSADALELLAPKNFEEN